MILPFSAMFFLNVMHAIFWVNLWGGSNGMKRDMMMVMSGNEKGLACVYLVFGIEHGNVML